MITIKEIAEKAGVSETIVAKVIHNYPEVNEDIRKKIKNIIEDSNNNLSLENSKKGLKENYTIGINFTDHLNNGLRNPVFRDIIYGIESMCFDYGYDVLHFAHTWGVDYSYKEKIQARGVDGCVLMGMPRNDPNIDKLIKSEIPTVFIDIDIIGKNTSYVISDNVQGAKDAVNYLYKLGHEKIGMIMGQWITKPAQDRFVGFQKAKDQLSLVNKNDWIVETEFSENGGYEAMKKILNNDELPTAIFCQSDEMAMGAIKAVQKKGLSVPEDFSFIGFDDIEISSYFNPPLTTIKQDKVLLGRRAASLLFNIFEGERGNPFPLVIPTELIERKSCKFIK